jgi:hypothetical protein
LLFADQLGPTNRSMFDRACTVTPTSTPPEIESLSGACQPQVLKLTHTGLRVSLVTQALRLTLGSRRSEGPPRSAPADHRSRARLV